MWNSLFQSSSPVSFCVVAGLFFMNSSFWWKQLHLLAAAPRGRPPLTLPTTISLVVSKFSNFQIWTDYFQKKFSFFFGVETLCKASESEIAPFLTEISPLTRDRRRWLQNPIGVSQLTVLNNGFFILVLIMRLFFHISIIFLFYCGGCLRCL